MMLCLVSPPAHAAPPGSLLKAQPSGIIDENDKVVGNGPPLNVVAGGGKAVDGATLSAYQRSMAWLGNFLQQLTIIERDMMMVSQSLATESVAVKELRDSIASLERTRELLNRTGATKNISFYDDLIKQKQADLKAIEKDQNGLIDGMKKRWTELDSDLIQQIDDSKEFPEFRLGLLNLKRNFEQKKTLSDLRLQLSAGHSREFRQLADRTQDNDALRMPVMLMRIADYIDKGEGRNALYASRLGMQLYPDNAAFKSFNRSQEASYLKMIGAKAEDDGARIHKAWSDYGGEVSDSWVKQFFFGSMRHTIDIGTGKAWELEQIQKTAVGRAAMEHNGIEVVGRLRDKGLTFDEIKALSPAQLPEKLGLKNPLSAESAGMFHDAVKSAFQNTDVKRLLIQNKEQFDVDTNRSYYGQEEFDTGLLEYAADSISVKNAILFFGPGAVIGQGGRGAMAKFATKLGMEEKAAMGLMQAEFEGAISAQELMMKPLMNTTAKFMGSSNVGRKVLGVMKNAADIRYFEVSKSIAAGEGYAVAAGRALAGTSVGVGEALAQMVVFEAGGKIGHWAGGDMGQFLMQAAVTFGGSPLEALHSWQGREALALEKAATQLAERKARWSQMNDFMEKNVRAPIRDTMKQVAAGETPSQAAIRQLEEAIENSEKVRAGAPVEGAAADGALVQAAAEEAEALAAAGRALKKGDAVLAEAADDIARAQQSAGKATLVTLENGEPALQQAARRAKAQTHRVGDEPPSNPVGKGPVEETSFANPEDLTEVFKPGAKAVPPVEPPPILQLQSGGTPGECISLAEQAMRDKRFADAAAHYRAGLELKLQAGEIPAGNKRSWLKNIDNAEQAARYSERNAQRAVRNQALAKESDMAQVPFTKEEKEIIGRITYEQAPEIPGTAGGPRKMIAQLGDGPPQTIGIWKPKTGRTYTMTADGQAIAEVMYSWFARKMGLRVPHAEKWNLVKATGEVEEGVLIRFIPHAMNLEKLTPGAILSMKDQIAKFRPLQVLTGHWDVHFGNYMVDKAGRVWSIDAGFAELATMDKTWFDNILNFYEIRGGRKLDLDWTGDTVMDYTRMWRDLYRVHNFEKTQQTVRALDNLMTAGEMSGAAREAKRFSAEEFNKMVDEVMPLTGDRERIGEILRDRRNVKETFKARQDNLEKLLDERWAGAGGGTPGAWRLPEKPLPRVVGAPSNPLPEATGNAMPNNVLPFPARPAVAEVIALPKAA